MKYLLYLKEKLILKIKQIWIWIQKFLNKKIKVISLKKHVKTNKTTNL